MTISVGDKIRVTNSVWDDGEDHHPPGWLAFCGEVLVVRKIGYNGKLAVSHEHITDNSFWINPNEYEVAQRNGCDWI